MILNLPYWKILSKMNKTTLLKEWMMILIHEFWNCLMCGQPVEVIDIDRDAQYIECDACGYGIEFADKSFEIYTREF